MIATRRRLEMMPMDAWLVHRRIEKHSSSALCHCDFPLFPGTRHVDDCFVHLHATSSEFQFALDRTRSAHASSCASDVVCT